VSGARPVMAVFRKPRWGANSSSNMTGGSVGAGSGAPP
jgi:hypothetical protein